MIRFQTRNSRYEIDEASTPKRIRRLGSNHAPTPRQLGDEIVGPPDEDCWQPIQGWELMVGSVYIIWREDEWGVRGTLTSTLRCTSCGRGVLEPGCLRNPNDPSANGGHTLFENDPAQADA